MITALAGGVGAARFLRGLVAVVPPERTTAIVNTGDDLVLHGLYICPDLDTVTYTLAGVIDPATGWGRAEESWRVMDQLGRLGGRTWFRLGDMDLATHLYRTQRLSEGVGLSVVASELAAAWELDVRMLPMSDDPVRTVLRVPGQGEVSFQDYFVRQHHDVTVESVSFAGVEDAAPAPGVLDAVAAADAIIICPSNPIVSIGPIVAVPGMRQALESRRERVVAISPIIAGAAVKGPADRLMRELGHDASVVGVARLYGALAGTLVIDRADEDLAGAVEAQGIRVVITETLMSTPAVAADLARAALASVLG